MSLFYVYYIPVKAVTTQGVRLSGKYSTRRNRVATVFATRSHPESCIFHTAQLCGALTGLLFYVGWRRLISSSRISFDLLLCVSIFIVKLAKNGNKHLKIRS